MNKVNRNTVAALRALAPETIHVDGVKYTHKGCLYDNEKNTVHWDYAARKEPEAMMASKVRVQVTYNEGNDLYDIKVVHFDAETLDCTELREWKFATFEAFELIGSGTLRVGDGKAMEDE